MNINYIITSIYSGYWDDISNGFRGIAYSTVFKTKGEALAIISSKSIKACYIIELYN